MRQRVWNSVNNLRVILGFVLTILLLVICVIVRMNMTRTAPTERPVRSIFRATNRYWEKAKETSYRSVPELINQHRFELELGMRRNILMNGSTVQKKIALTFDDGPHPRYTKKILAILDRYNVKATFFLVGKMAERYPKLVEAEVAGGHSIGNHTYHHVNLTKIPVGYVATEIVACDEVLQNITNKPVHLFRPPGGDYDDSVAEVCEALKHTVVLWTDDPKDYARPSAEVIKQRVLHRVGDGGIILIHDGVQQTLDALPSILQTLKDRGYQTVTVDEMLDERGWKL